MEDMLKSKSRHLQITKKKKEHRNVSVVPFFLSSFLAFSEKNDTKTTKRQEVKEKDGTNMSR